MLVHGIRTPDQLGTDSVAPKLGLIVNRNSFCSAHCVGVIFIKKGPPGDEWPRFRKQLNHFLESAYEYGYIYWIFFKILIKTGMWKGEAGALQWSDINFNEGTITINKSLDYHRKGKDKMFGEVRTDHSARFITIRKSVIDELRFHLNWQNQNKKNRSMTYTVMISI